MLKHLLLKVNSRFWTVSYVNNLLNAAGYTLANVS